MNLLYAFSYRHSIMLQDFKEIIEFQLFKLNNVSITISNVLLLLVIFLMTRFLIRASKMIINRSLQSKHWIDEGKRYTITILVQYLITTVAVLLAFESVGLNLSIILAGSAALFVGIGFGLQTIFADIVSGFFLLFEGSIQVGDIVELSGTVGQVEKIDIRTSKIKTRDGITMVVPNSNLISNTVINWSHNNKQTRFMVEVGVAYGSDTELVKTTLIQCVSNHKDVSTEHPILVRFDDFGDSSLLFRVFFWSHKMWEIELIRSDIRFAIDKAFREKGITIPFPQRDIHIIKGE